MSSVVIVILALFYKGLLGFSTGFFWLDPAPSFGLILHPLLA